MSSRIRTDQDMNIGWQCPGCGSCYSPWTDRCTRCGNEVKITGGLGRPEPGTFTPIRDFEQGVADVLAAEPADLNTKTKSLGMVQANARACRGCGKVRCNNSTVACDGRT